MCLQKNEREREKETKNKLVSFVEKNTTRTS